MRTFRLVTIMVVGGWIAMHLWGITAKEIPFFNFVAGWLVMLITADLSVRE